MEEMIIQDAFWDGNDLYVLDLNDRWWKLTNARFTDSSLGEFRNSSIQVEFNFKEEKNEYI